jgi:hypothetical protein
MHTFKTALLTACFAANSTFADQCYIPSDPVRLTSEQQRSVVLTIASNPDVFLSDFSLKKTLRSILESTPGADPAQIGDVQIEQFLATMLEDLATPELTNTDAEITYAMKPRPGETALTAKALLTDGGPDEMKPVGLFNRLDLTPGSFANCGEFRIVYAKQQNEPNPFLDRLTLIFEAALANPSPTFDRQGCHAAWNLWKGFNQPTAQLSDSDIGKALARFYYEGGALGNSLPYAKVMHYKHLGNPDGQVRANAFVRPAQGQNWHLRQWLVFFDANSPLSTAKFEPHSLGENPVPGLFDGSDPGVTPSDKQKYEALVGLFQNTFIDSNVEQLTAVDTRAAIPSEKQESVADLIDNLGVQVDDRFYAMDSDAGPFDAPADDDPAIKVTPSNPLWVEIAAKLDELKVGKACNITQSHVLNRMGAMSCGGCHQFSNGKEIAPGIRWPLSLNFVHIDEGGKLSSLLLDRFLPFRFSLFAKIPETAPVSTQVLSSQLESLDLKDLLSSQQMLNDELSALRVGRSEQQLNTVTELREEIRATNKSMRGAFVRFRKPD